ncbi:MAG: nucleotidyl transferase AbiEii/AbiGii toxin family protein [Actinomycetota bacterium]
MTQFVSTSRSWADPGVTRFRDTDEFGPTLDAVAERLDISATAVEKDYWVSEVLRVLVATFPEDFIFKGGTSLSKGYGIVERFSEDIDVLVLPGNRGRGAVDKLMKAMGEAAAAGVQGEASGVGGAESGRHRSFAVTYPARREPTALIATSVLLEMGVRGGSHPHEDVVIGCLLRDTLDAAGTELGEYEDLAPFEVRVLHPARTLLEKLVHIHELANQLAADEARPASPRSGRHFYDVHQLLGDDRVLTLLQNREQTLEVVASIDEITQQFFGGLAGVSARPDGGFATSPAFDPATSVSARLRTAYELTMPELYFGRDPLPSWDAICRRVADHAALL